jgi:hypothetical protein
MFVRKIEVCGSYMRVQTNMKCHARLIREGFLGTFRTDKKRLCFYAEDYCNENACDDGLVCEAHRNRIPCVKSNAPQDNRYDHGYIHMPIPEESHIFGSTWYMKKETIKGEPSIETKAEAIEHANRVKSYVESMLHEASSESSVEPVAKKKKRVVKKKQEVLDYNPPCNITFQHPIKILETMEEPIVVDDIETYVVESYVIDDEEVYLCRANNEVFSMEDYHFLGILENGILVEP